MPTDPCTAERSRARASQSRAASTSHRSSATQASATATVAERSDLSGTPRDVGGLRLAGELGRPVEPAFTGFEERQTADERIAQPACSDSRAGSGRGAHRRQDLRRRRVSRQGRHAPGPWRGSRTTPGRRAGPPPAPRRRRASGPWSRCRRPDARDDLGRDGEGGGRAELDPVRRLHRGGRDAPEVVGLGDRRAEIAVAARATAASGPGRSSGTSARPCTVNSVVPASNRPISFSSTSRFVAKAQSSAAIACRRPVDRLPGLDVPGRAHAMQPSEVVRVR